MSLLPVCLLCALSTAPPPPVVCNGIESMLRQANVQLAHASVETAAKLLAPHAQDSAACPGMQLALARLAAASRAAETPALFERYLAAQPEDAAGMAYYARFLLDREQYQRADDASAAALAKGPDTPAALAVRGQILGMKGAQQQAIDLLTRACTLEPEDVLAQFALASLENHARHPGAAVLHLEKVVAITPQNSQAWDYLALNRERLSETDQALEAYTKGLAVNQQGNPDFDAFLDYNYGRLLSKLNRLADSKIHLDKAVELVPEMRATWYERAKLDLLLKDYPRARKDAEQAAALPDSHGYIIDLQIYTLLEQVYTRVGDTTLAAKYADLERQTPPPVRGEHP